MHLGEIKINPKLCGKLNLHTTEQYATTNGSALENYLHGVQNRGPKLIAD